MRNLLIITIPVLLGSCSVRDDAVRYLLEPSVSPRVANASQPAVAIARPTLPPYLERTELVTRSASGTLKIHEKDLWAEPLDKGISRVVADNLRRLTKSANIQPAGNFITQDYTKIVEIRIERFDPLPDGSVILECTWKAQPVGGGDASMNSFSTTVSVSVSDGKHTRIVAMNEGLERLSKTIAKSL